MLSRHGESMECIYILLILLSLFLAIVVFTSLILPPPLKIEENVFVYSTCLCLSLRMYGGFYVCNNATLSLVTLGNVLIRPREMIIQS